MEEVYPGLINNRRALALSPESVVLIPLCGKSVDIAWFARYAGKVIGVEISEKAILEFFEEQNLHATTGSFGRFTIFRAQNIEIWCGDFLKLPVHKMPDISLIYDKAALVALPPHMREKYARKLITIAAAQTKLLLQSFDYKQAEMPGPPFSVQLNEIEQLFGNFFSIAHLEKKDRLLNNYQKFVKRGLKSYLIEYLLLLSVKNSIT